MGQTKMETRSDFTDGQIIKNSDGTYSNAVFDTGHKCVYFYLCDENGLHIKNKLGDKIYHRIDGAAVINEINENSCISYWYYNQGKPVGFEKGPAHTIRTKDTGEVIYFKYVDENGRQHNYDGFPAVFSIKENGEKYFKFYQHGKLHNEYGPASIVTTINYSKTSTEYKYYLSGDMLTAEQLTDKVGHNKKFYYTSDNNSYIFYLCDKTIRLHCESGPAFMSFSKQTGFVQQEHYYLNGTVKPKQAVLEAFEKRKNNLEITAQPNNAAETSKDSLKPLNDKPIDEEQTNVDAKISITELTDLPSNLPQLAKELINKYTYYSKKWKIFKTELLGCTSYTLRFFDDEFRFETPPGNDEYSCFIWYEDKDGRWILRKKERKIADKWNKFSDKKPNDIEFKADGTASYTAWRDENGNYDNVNGPALIINDTNANKLREEYWVLGKKLKIFKPEFNELFGGFKTTSAENIKINNIDECITIEFRDRWNRPHCLNGPCYIRFDKNGNLESKSYQIHGIMHNCIGASNVVYKRDENEIITDVYANYNLLGVTVSESDFIKETLTHNYIADDLHIQSVNKSNNFEDASFGYSKISFVESTSGKQFFCRKNNVLNDNSIFPAYSEFDGAGKLIYLRHFEDGYNYSRHEYSHFEENSTHIVKKWTNKKGDLHNENGPAYLSLTKDPSSKAANYEMYYINGNCSREDGPAKILRENGKVTNEYFLNGVQYPSLEALQIQLKFNAEEDKYMAKYLEACPPLKKLKENNIELYKQITEGLRKDNVNAAIDKFGFMITNKCGRYHCLDGPANIRFYEDGILNVSYYINGFAHNSKGSAYEKYNSKGESIDKVYSILGCTHTEEEFKKAITELMFTETNGALISAKKTDGKFHSDIGHSYISFNEVGKPVSIECYTDGKLNNIRNLHAGIYYDDDVLTKKIMNFRDGKLLYDQKEPTKTIHFVKSGISIYEYFDDLGRYHRDNGPAYLKEDSAGRIIEYSYYSNGILSRSDGPARFKKDDSGQITEEYRYMGRTFPSYQELKAYVDIKLGNDKKNIPNKTNEVENMPGNDSAPPAQTNPTGPNPQMSDRRNKLIRAITRAHQKHLFRLSKTIANNPNISKNLADSLKNQDNAINLIIDHIILNHKTNFITIARDNNNRIAYAKTPDVMYNEDKRTIIDFDRYCVKYILGKKNPLLNEVAVRDFIQDVKQQIVAIVNGQFKPSITQEEIHAFSLPAENNTSSASQNNSSNQSNSGDVAEEDEDSDNEEFDEGEDEEEDEEEADALNEITDEIVNDRQRLSDIVRSVSSYIFAKNTDINGAPISEEADAAIAAMQELEDYLYFDEAYLQYDDDLLVRASKNGKVAFKRPNNDGTREDAECSLREFLEDYGDFQFPFNYSDEITKEFFSICNKMLALKESVKSAINELDQKTQLIGKEKEIKAVESMLTVKQPSDDLTLRRNKIVNAMKNSLGKIKNKYGVNGEVQNLINFVKEEMDDIDNAFLSVSRDNPTRISFAKSPEFIFDDEKRTKKDFKKYIEDATGVIDNAIYDEFVSNVENFLIENAKKITPTPTTTPEKKMNKPTNAGELVSMVKSDAIDAGYRVAANQLTKGLKGGILLMLKDKGMEDAKMQAIKEVLDSEMGSAILSSVIGYTLMYVPSINEDPRVQRLAKEFRIEGMAIAGNVVVDAAMGYLIPAVKEALKSLPPVENVEKKIEENSEEEVEETIEKKTATA